MVNSLVASTDRDDLSSSPSPKIMLFKNCIQHLWKTSSRKTNGKKIAPTSLISLSDSD